MTPDELEIIEQRANAATKRRDFGLVWPVKEPA